MDVAHHPDRNALFTPTKRTRPSCSMKPKKKTKPEPKAQAVVKPRIAASQEITISIRGQDIKLTPDEAFELRDALIDIVGEPIDDFVCDDCRNDEGSSDDIGSVGYPRYVFDFPSAKTGAPAYPSQWFTTSEHPMSYYHPETRA